MVILDRYTHRAWYVPCNQTITGKQTADILFDRIVTHQGLPSVIISDRDPRFKSSIWKGIWKRCGTKLAMTVSSKASANGLVENGNRTMQDMLRAFVNETKTDWDIKLPALEIAHNSSVNSATGFAPFELDIGMMPRMPIDIAVGTGTNLSVDKFLSRWEDNWSLAHENIAKAQQRQKDRTDDKRIDVQYQVGDKAWVRIDKGSLQTNNMAGTKLASRVEGPYTVSKLHGDCVVTLDLPKGDRRNKQFHLSQLKPFVLRDEIKFPDAQIESTNYVIGKPNDTDQEQGGDEAQTEQQEMISNNEHDSTMTTTRSKRIRKQVDYGVFIKH